MADKGEGSSPGGAAMGVLVITPDDCVKGTGTVKWREREAHKKVRGHYQDTATGRREHVDVDTGDPDGGEATYSLRHNYADKDEAERAARSRAQSLQREADSTSVTVIGNPYIKGGSPMIYAGIHPQVDGLEFIIEKAATSFSHGMGFRTGIQARASTKDGGGKGKHKGPKIIGARPNTSMSRARGG
jgi:phage protein D